jgi:hypothetical protein
MIFRRSALKGITTGLSKSIFRRSELKGIIPHLHPCLKPCKEDAVLLYKNKNPDTKLTGDILEQTAEKAKLAYPLPQKQNKIRFNRLKNHYDLIATWERKLQKMSSLKFF